MRTDRYLTAGGINMKRTKSLLLVIILFSITIAPTDFVANYVQYIYDTGW